MNVNTQLVGSVLKIKLNGKFTFDGHRAFRAAYKDHLDPACSVVEIDFSGVDYLDSSALGMLLLVRQAAEHLGKVVKLVGCRGMVAQVLSIANFSRLFEIAG